jgi:hypothetical protein
MCTKPNEAPGADRKRACENLVAETNSDAGKPKAAKTCKSLLKSSRG